MQVEDRNYYLSNADERGWTKANLDGLGSRFLCYGTKVEKIKIDNKFEYIKILDGPFRDFFAKIPFKKVDSKISFLRKLPEDYKENPVKIFYYSDKEQVDIEGLGLFKTAKSSVSLFKGTYFLEIPSYPHKKTPISYLKEEQGGSKFAETWFRVVPLKNSNSDIFFHFGKLSEGCITINQPNSWNIIYYHLIRRRFNRLNVGEIEVR